MAKQGTLLAFFSPKAKSEPACKESPTALNKSASKTRSAKKQNGKNGKDYDINLEAGDLVLTKLATYPWWPSLVCQGPSGKIKKGGNKSAKFHVQFFDEPILRSWIPAKYIVRKSDISVEDTNIGGKYYSSDPKWKKSMEQFYDAEKLTVEDRLSLVVDFMSTDDEDDAIKLDTNKNEKGDLKKNDDNEMDVNDEDIPKSGRRKKRKKNYIESDSEAEDIDVSEDEFEPDESSSDEDIPEEEVEEEILEEKDASIEEEIMDIVESPPKKGKKRKSTTQSFQPARKRLSLDTSLTISNKTEKKLEAFTVKAKSTEASSAPGSYKHLTFEFLHEDKIKDIEGRPKSHPDYDPKTLHVPKAFLDKQTPAMRQWWQFKSNHLDVILLFKMGKFYEMFHMDAVLAIKEMNLIMMKGDYAHAGFPESAFSRHADALIEKGYKVARIEQTETPEMMQKRLSKMSKCDKVVRRELCRITSKGTRICSFIDGDSTAESNSYLLAFCEIENSTGSETRYGVCFVDTTIGEIHIGEFNDDRHRSKFQTLIAHFPPTQILIEKGHTSEKTQQIVSSQLSHILQENLKPKSEFLESDKCLKVLKEEKYFSDGESDSLDKWPEGLKEMLAEGDVLGLTAKREYQLAIKSLGAIVWYFKRCLIDAEILSLGNVTIYTPPEVKNQQDNTCDLTSNQRKMIIDGVSLNNLEILCNNAGTNQGTLLEKINFCNTAFGRRLLCQWICSPLINPSAINERLDAIDDIRNHADIFEKIGKEIKLLPDLPRLLKKVHSLGSNLRSQNHPDSRAILFDSNVYSKRQIEDFLLILKGFTSCLNIISSVSRSGGQFKSQLLRKCVSFTEDGGNFPDYSDQLDFFQCAFNQAEAKRTGTIKPNKGTDIEYDEAIENIDDLEQQLEDFLSAQKKKFGSSAICYFGSGKNRYQVEIPEKIKVPSSYSLISSRKGFKRYRTEELEDLIAKLTKAEEYRDTRLKDSTRKVFHQFSANFHLWDKSTQCVAVLDILMSLAKFSLSFENNVCRPEFKLPDKGIEPFLYISQGRHPCISKTYSGSDFIPNDTVIGKLPDSLSDYEQKTGIKDASLIMVTGPNMGGKSTLMRQVGLITVLAQLGSYVPAERCVLTPVDRLFTRLGASDKIMAGESTFFVEMSETSAIMHHATQHSLVLIDELGRGTATYDGTAIASAVANELSRFTRCRTLFSTHYHSLAEHHAADNNIGFGHMACMVENDSPDGEVEEESVTFLYQFTEGACPKSHGFNAAKLADLPAEVIKRAREKADLFEKAHRNLQLTKSIYFAQTDQDWMKSFDKLRGSGV
ncbi:DgyrCDS451 [Dimorphilus gyrociliatus]|uniref:DNA mismatch repair protein n=1 Tax=Dimorphilus gyrociliatus TaxID=2664684 RepID=A0A7I8V7E1_9ANNE|nr:DgyrCDS451 [Dimorphilus gyrociliatus]